MSGVRDQVCGEPGHTAVRCYRKVRMNRAGIPEVGTPSLSSRDLTRTPGSLSAECREIQRLPAEPKPWAVRAVDGDQQPTRE